jgi:hypothetical protein
MRFLKSLGLALLLAASAQAQNAETDTDAVVVTDSLSSIVEPKAEADSVFLFDSVAVESIAPVPERAIPDSVLQRLRSDDAFWYANADFKKKTTEPQDFTFLQRLFRQEWFRTLLWAIIIGAFLFVLILFFTKSNIRLFHRAPAALSTRGEAVLTENIFSIDYKTEISKAVQAGDYRLAIRLYYLQTLKLLSAQNIIQYKEDFTNSDYLLQLRPTSYYTAFKKLTRHFEYTWYGEFYVSADGFKTIETDFSTFKNSMGI